MWDQRLRYLISLAFASQDLLLGGFAYLTPYQLRRITNCALHLPYCVTTSLKRIPGGIGISTDFPSTTPFGLALGPDLPWADEPSPGNLRFSAGRILTCLFAYLYRHSLFLALQHSLRYTFAALRMLPYPRASKLAQAEASVTNLSPVTFSAQNRWTSELLRTL